MTYLKIVIPIVIIVVIIVGGGGFYLYKAGIFEEVWGNFFPGGETTITITPPKPREIDKLFTTFVYMPLLDYSRGYAASDPINWATNNVAEQIIKGLCFRQYEVGIGYSDVTKLFSSYQKNACNGEVQRMPHPEILSTNTVESQVEGNYTRLDCDLWDQVDSTGERKSHHYIEETLKQDGQWVEIIESSQEILLGYMRIYCQVSTPDEEMTN